MVQQEGTVVIVLLLVKLDAASQASPTTPQAVRAVVETCAVDARHKHRDQVDGQHDVALLPRRRGLQGGARWRDLRKEAWPAGQVGFEVRIKIRMLLTN